MRARFARLFWFCMLRQTLLSLSQSRSLRRWMEDSPSAKRVTRRFIAGQNLSDAIAVASKLSNEGILCTLDFLGENVTSLDEAVASKRAYLVALRQLQPFGSTVSLKLTQFGLDLSRDACLANVAELVECAQHQHTRVEIDMESSHYTESTIGIVRELNSRYPDCLRVAVQAYLYRTESDIRTLSTDRIPVRLCKGAYNEPPSVAFPQKSQVDDAYEKLTRELLQSGAYPAIASHDERMVRNAISFAKEHDIRPDQFEFQMLYGIRRDLQRELLNQGYRLRLYVPFGQAWFPYFMRRLAERPANVLFIARNLFRT